MIERLLEFLHPRCHQLYNSARLSDDCQDVHSAVRGGLRDDLDTRQVVPGLPAALRRELLARGQIKKFSRGAWIYLQGDPPRGLWAVLDGGRLETIANTPD